jgi:hypothetical protein
MSAEVSIDYAVVEKVATTLGSTGEKMAQVANSLRAAANLLQVSGFAGLIGTVSQVLLDEMGKSAENLGKKCNDTGADVKAAVEALKNGDTSGSTRFAN